MLTRRRFLVGTAVGFAAARLASPSHAAAPGWTQATPMPIKAQELYPAVHQGKLVVAGGIVSGTGGPGFTGATFSYDPETDRWHELAPMPESRHHAAMVSTGRDLFIAGGFQGSQGAVWQMLDTVLAWSDDRWLPVVSMPQPQAEGVLAHYRDDIVHLATGQSLRGEANRARSDHQEVDAHWRWDTSDGQWESAAPIPTPRNSATGGWIGNALIVTGGRTAAGNLDVTEIYDAAEDRWRTAAPMPLPQAGTASVVTGDSLIVFGGEIFQPQPSVFPNVWRYRLDQDRWEALPHLPTPRHGLGAGFIGNRAYVIGGATRPGGSGTSDANEVLTLT